MIISGITLRYDKRQNKRNPSHKEKGKLKQYFVDTFIGPSNGFESEKAARQFCLYSLYLNYLFRSEFLYCKGVTPVSFLNTRMK
jgi:hypothetical protein